MPNAYGAVNNQESSKFSVVIKRDAYQNLINSTLGDKDLARQFVADISTVVANNPALQECDAGSIVAAGLTAVSLKLPLAPTLGYCYIVPFKNKFGQKVAQFQVGYKGFIQLAERSSQYKDIGVDIVREGEYLGRDETTGKPKFHFISDDEDAEKKPVVGYYAYFEMLNGFTKTSYMSKAKCEAHAKRYSQTYQRGYGKWTEDFDAMAEKTVLKLLLAKFGIMSVEIQKSLELDQAVIKDGKPDYVDNAPEIAEDNGDAVQDSAVEPSDVKEEAEEEAPASAGGQGHDADAKADVKAKEKAAKPSMADLLEEGK